MRLAFRSASCKSRMSALLRLKNSMIRGSCSPRLMFQHTTLNEFSGQRSHRGLAKLPVSISGTRVSISLGYGLSFRGRAPRPTFNSTRISFSFRRTRLCFRSHAGGCHGILRTSSKRNKPNSVPDQSNPQGIRPAFALCVGHILVRKGQKHAVFTTHARD